MHKYSCFHCPNRRLYTIIAPRKGVYKSWEALPATTSLESIKITPKINSH